MFNIEINDGEFNLKCLGYTSGLVSPTRGRAINLTFKFERIPDILIKFGTSGKIIDKIKVYNIIGEKYKKYLPSYICCKILSISQKTRSTVHMRALRLEHIRSEVKRVCANPKCGRSINYLYVMCELIRKKVDEETAENIWNSDIVKFYCCYCFVDRFKS